MSTKPYYKVIVKVAHYCYSKEEAEVWLYYMENKFGENVEEKYIVDSEEAKDG